MVKFWKFTEKLTTSQSIRYCLKCKICNEKETYIEKTIGDNTKRFKVRINQQFSDCNTRVSKCKLPRHVYDCDIKNNCLEELFFSLNIMLRLDLKPFKSISI